jgi:hypothetical protein
VATPTDESETASQYEVDIPFKQRKINIEEYIRCSSSGSSSTPSHTSSSSSSSSPPSFSSSSSSLTSRKHHRDTVKQRHSRSGNDHVTIRTCASASTAGAGCDAGADDTESTEDDTYDDMKDQKETDSDNDLEELTSVVDNHLHKQSHLIPPRT